MSTFEYKAIDEKGRAVSGITEAGSIALARRNVQRAFKHVVELELKPGQGFHPGRIPVQVLLFYTQQLAAMIGAGVPLTASLHFLSHGDHPRMNLVMNSVSRSVLQGKRLSVAMAEFPSVFPKIYVGLMATAEASGKMHLVLSKLSGLLERQASMKKRLISTLAYPAMLVFVSSAVSCFIVFYILPVLRPMFNQVGMELPAPTRMLITVADSLRNPKFWAVGLVVIMGGGFLLRGLFETGSEHPGGLRYRLDELVLEIPLLGKFLNQAASAQSLYALSLMLNAGMSVIEAFVLLERVTSNCFIRDKLRKARLSLREGCRIEESLRRHRVFPRGALQMLRAGEESGQIDEMMLLVANTFEMDIDMTLIQLGATIEPVIMAIMGVVIGFICVASLLPVINFVNQI